MIHLFLYLYEYNFVILFLYLQVIIYLFLFMYEYYFVNFLKDYNRYRVDTRASSFHHNGAILR